MPLPKKKFSFFVPMVLVPHLKNLAKIEGRSVSGQITVMLEEFFRSNEIPWILDDAGSAEASLSIESSDPVPAVPTVSPASSPETDDDEGQPDRLESDPDPA
jgi:hypothetical protein